MFGVFLSFLFPSLPSSALPFPFLVVVSSSLIFD